MATKPNFEIEKPLWEQEHAFILGIDEAGYGSGVGSLCVAGVIFPANMSQDELPEGLNDSKKLSPKKREKIFEEIMKKALAVQVVFGTAEEIDSINVLQTNLKCMKRILENIEPSPDFVLIDGIHKPNLNDSSVNCPSITIPKGDSRSATIAAASIVAKVSRDRYIGALVEENPELIKYGVHKNMGYLSSEHRKALDDHGRSKFHRQSYKYKWQTSKTKTQ